MQKQFAVITGIAMLAVAGTVVTQNSGILQGSLPHATSPVTGSLTSSDCSVYEPWCQNTVSGGGQCCRVDWNCDPNDGSCDDPNLPPPPPPSTPSSSSAECSDKPVTDPEIHRRSRTVLYPKVMDDACEAAHAEVVKKCNTYEGIPPSCNPPDGCYDEKNGLISKGPTNVQTLLEPGKGRSTCVKVFQCTNTRACKDAMYSSGAMYSSAHN